MTLPPNPYWQHDVAVDLGATEPQIGFGVRFKVHEAAEHYGRSSIFVS